MKEKANVYDFDNTIYRGNSGPEFFLFCLLRYPKLIKYVPINGIGLLKYKFTKGDISNSGIEYCEFLKDLTTEEINKLVDKFWNKNISKINKWYFDVKEKKDIVVTSGVDFLVKEACNRIGIKRIIATKVNIDNGKFIGELCYKEEKLKRFKKEYKKTSIINFYSDRPLTDDKYLSDLATGSIFIVKGKKVVKQK
jgi:phosphatidylglycerophosphatase C